MDFSLLINGKVDSDIVFPLQVRLYTESGKYIVGSETEWANINDIKVDAYLSQLGASSYESFTLEVKWEYEGGNDELDTLLGNMSAAQGSGNGGEGQSIAVNLGISTYAEHHVDPTDQGGTPIDAETHGDVEYGGTVRWLWFILLFINIGMLIFYISWLLNKRANKW